MRVDDSALSASRLTRSEELELADELSGNVQHGTRIPVVHVVRRGEDRNEASVRGGLVTGGLHLNRMARHLDPKTADALLRCESDVRGR